MAWLLTAWSGRRGGETGNRPSRGSREQGAVAIRGVFWKLEDKVISGGLPSPVKGNERTLQHYYYLLLQHPSNIQLHNHQEPEP